MQSGSSVLECPGQPAPGLLFVWASGTPRAALPFRRSRPPGVWPGLCGSAWEWAACRRAVASPFLAPLRACSPQGGFSSRGLCAPREARQGEFRSHGLGRQLHGATACLCELCVPLEKSPSLPVFAPLKNGDHSYLLGLLRGLQIVFVRGPPPAGTAPALRFPPTGAWGWGSNHLRSMTRNGRVVGVLAGGGRGREEADPCWPLMPVGPVHSLAQLAFPRTPRGKPCSPLTRRGAGPSPPPSHWAAPNRLRRGGSFRV